jgi:hypothetical protein
MHVAQDRGQCLAVNDKTLVFHNMLVIHWVADQLVASLERHSYINIWY